MFNDVLLALWFFLPAGVANVTPILVAPLPGLKRLGAPIDCGITFRGRAVLGAHKTWRGLISGVFLAVLVLWLQQFIFVHSGWVRGFADQVDYHHLPTIGLGILFGVGALGGDAIESFFKRQKGVAPGHGWFPWDQLDYIIGAALATMPLVALSFAQYAWLIVLWLAMHVIFSYLGWLLRLKERPI